MDNKTLLEWLKAYFPATNGLTLKEIGVRTRYMNDDARHKLKNCIVECITNRFGRVSFAEIYEVAKERGIDFQRPEPEPEYDVQPVIIGEVGDVSGLWRSIYISAGISRLLSGVWF